MGTPTAGPAPVSVCAGIVPTASGGPLHAAPEKSSIPASHARNSSSPGAHTSVRLMSRSARRDSPIRLRGSVPVNGL